MCSAHARSAHHEAKPRIMPAGRIMFRGGGTHHSPSVLTNTRRMGGFFLSLGRARSYPPPVKIPGANIWLNDACPDGQMMFLPIVKNDAASCGRDDAMCSAHARSAHHEAKPRIMPAGRIMFRGGGTHHSPSVLTNTRRFPHIRCASGNPALLSMLFATKY